MLPTFSASCEVVPYKTHRSECCLLRLLRVQDEFLHTPVGDLAHVNFVRVAAIDLVDRSEFLVQLARMAELAQDFSIELHFVDFAVVHVGGAVRVGAIEVLVRARGYADGPWRADIEVHRLKFTVVIEDLNPAVFPVADVYVPLGVRGDRVHGMKLAGLRPSGAPGLDEFSVLVELRDARIVVAIGDEDVSIRIPRDVGGPVKIVARDSRAWQTLPRRTAARSRAGTASRPARSRT